MICHSITGRAGNMEGKKSLVLFSLFLALFLPTASAQSITYLSMNPDTQFCISVIFGDNGRGEYTLTVDDPAYPGGGWVDTHRTSFTSGPNNPVINPVCFSTKNRRVGDEAVLHFTLETPEGEIRYDYGICVSKHEDVDVVESSEDPCKAASSHTDLFSVDLLESEMFSIPGEKVTYTLLLSSEFDLSISLDKESGPKMDISSTTIETPGEYTVEIVVDSPQEPGDHAFTIVARANDCDYPSCEKRVTGTLHVSTAPGLEGFRVELSPKSKNVMGTQSAKFFLTIHNFASDQGFSVSLDLDESLNTNFIPLDVRVGKDMSKQIDFTIVPLSDDHKLYMIRAEVEGETGGKKTAESFLTVEEPVADVQRMAESDPGLRPDADDYAAKYNAGPSLDDWKGIQEATSVHDDKPKPPNGQSGPLNWLLIFAAVVAIAAIILYVYKKTMVVQETEQPYSGY